MTRFITSLFASKTTSRPIVRKTSLSLTSMEDRFAPAALNPGSIRGFDPQPEPPMVHVGAMNPGTIRGIVISGG